ncbi:class I SAM-dependent methyltransferase [Microbacterium horticulturae]|uniref:Class I SAM-dependent methyltransferase n=1 Tax=Microbacterium horticulturae TaxID=3028316 RepID=A0ABY8BTQ6_9MICO|nr:class I SAM-dependent methyltransferase [Microbacterium sp. KACC 23027]WEG07556.1 class I SAM-dependent methyltransferase [Microbacterium sp. KACC 23027]
MRDYDPRIVDLYDGDNPDGPDHDHFRGLADEIGARRILDVGCGTGILTVTLVDEGREVVGVDPSPAMLAYARRREGAEAVSWIHGDASAAPDEPFDLVVMSGNVAQHIPDPDWSRALADIRRAARHGATLAFESRNPAVRMWELWRQPTATRRETMHGLLEEWCQVEEQGSGRVLLRSFNRFVSTGDTVVQEDVLTFRDAETVTAQLADAGFAVAGIWGDWQRTPFDGMQPIMVFEARAR